MRIRVKPIRCPLDADLIEQVERAPPALPARRPAACLDGIAHLLADAADRVQGRSRILEDKGDLVAARRVHALRIGAEILAGEADRSAIDAAISRQQPNDAVGHHRLAGTALPDDPERFTWFDRQRNSVQRRDAAAPHVEADGEVFDLEQRRARAHHRRVLTSITSRSPSPRRLKQSTVSVRAAPGNIASHQ